LDFTNITRDDPDSLYKEALIMRGVGCKLAREHGLFKLLATFADPSMEMQEKAALVRRIDEGVSPLFGVGRSKKEKEEKEVSVEESLENLYFRVMKASKEQ
jgi:hypothetical protein